MMRRYVDDQFADADDASEEEMDDVAPSAPAPKRQRTQGQARHEQHQNQKQRKHQQQRQRNSLIHQFNQNAAAVLASAAAGTIATTNHYDQNARRNQQRQPQEELQRKHSISIVDLVDDDDDDEVQHFSSTMGYSNNMPTQPRTTDNRRPSLTMSNHYDKPTTPFTGTVRNVTTTGHDGKQKLEQPTAPFHRQQHEQGNVFQQDNFQQHLQQQKKAYHEISKIKECHVNWIPTWEVHKASRLVGQNLRLFPESSPGSHVQASETIEAFGKHVFLPYIISQNTSFRDTTTSTPDENGTGTVTDRFPSGGKPMNQERVFYATLLALREVLAQNADTIFQIPTPEENMTDQMENDEIKNKEKKDESSSSISPSLSPEDKKEELEYGKLLMATTIVMSACHAAGKDVDYLLSLIQQEGQDDGTHTCPFTSDRIVGIPTEPDGRVKPPEEAVAWKVGYNLALEERRKQRKQYRVTIPQPTAVWISVVEQLPSAYRRSGGGVVE